MKDTASVDDSITMIVTYRLSDEITTNDTTLKMVTYIMSEEIITDDSIRKTLMRPVSDSAILSDTITKTVTYRLSEMISTEDDISKISQLGIVDNIIVDDILRATIIKPVGPDSAILSDTITKTVTYRLSEMISTEDDISKISQLGIVDNIIVDDILRATIIKPVGPDSAILSDTITKTVTYRLSEMISTEDDISKISQLGIVDNIIVEDILRATIIKPVGPDSAILSDSITKTVTYRLSEMISTEDDISKISKLGIVDSIIVDDTIRWTITKVFGDEATVDDTIRFTITKVIDDEIATVEDIIVIAPVTFRQSDSTTVDDTIRWTLTRVFGDEATVDDTIRFTITKVIDDDIATVEDIIII